MTTTEMTPELLALLSPEQREAWERCQKATPGPWERPEESEQIVAGLIEQTGRHSLRYKAEICGMSGESTLSADDVFEHYFNGEPPCDEDGEELDLELAQVKAELAELRAAVEAAPHGQRCTVWCGCPHCERGDFEVHEYAMSPTCAPGGCDCWKSRLPK